MSNECRVLPFSKDCGSNNSTKKRQRKIQRGETSSAPNTHLTRHKLPLIELCEGPTRSQVLLRSIETMRHLDIQQLQIAEVLINAIARGRL